MNFISALDMFKIGIGPSSSHTLGPWKASLMFLEVLNTINIQTNNMQVQVDLYGSLAQTGKGHGTDIAIICGLYNLDYKTCKTYGLVEFAKNIYNKTPFSEKINNIVINFNPEQSLAFHANGLSFTAIDNTSNHNIIQKTYYSIGGGFVVDDMPISNTINTIPHPIVHAKDILDIIKEKNFTLPQLILANELSLHGKNIHQHLHEVWTTMQECMFDGCHTEGVLSGGLKVQRRAKTMHQRLTNQLSEYNDSTSWFNAIRNLKQREFSNVINWVSTFALAVNEQNAAFSRVVTAPTNGAAGVIPAVLMYALCFLDITSPENSKYKENIFEDFLLIASTIGGLFKQKATISAAMGGCQAEIGVSSAMAAGGLAYILGASSEQILVAAEIAMEHHLGLTCDPIGGLVQIPCIERNSMGAIKAITAANLAIQTNPEHAKVSLDDVITTMWHTALDMNSKYKETARGGLAIQIPVSLSEC